MQILGERGVQTLHVGFECLGGTICSVMLPLRLPDPSSLLYRWSVESPYVIQAAQRYASSVPCQVLASDVLTVVSSGGRPSASTTFRP
jgi:hypothetical protein